MASLSAIRPAALLTVVDRFSHPSILVLGDIILDSYIWGAVERICPEAPVPVVDVQRETTTLGGAANVVMNLRSLGAEVHLCGVVGDDQSCDEIKAHLKNIGAGSKGLILDSKRPTSRKTRVVAGHQQVVRFDHETKEAIREHTVKKLKKYLKDHWHSFDGIILSDYGKGVITPDLLKTIEKLNHKDKKIVAVDPKERNMEHYKNVTLVTPNKKEAAFAARKEINSVEDLKEAGRKIMHQLQCENLVITLGAEGMALFQSSGEFLKIPTFAKEVFDVSGAGDTAVGVLTLSLCSGAKLTEAVALANYASGVVVAKLGTAAVTTEELKKYIQGEKNRLSKKNITYQSSYTSQISN